MFRFLFGVIKLCLVLIVLTLVFHSFTLKYILKYPLSISVGAEVSINEASIDWKHSGFLVKGIRIENPINFPKGTMVEIPYLSAEIDFTKLIKKTICFRRLEVDFREIHIVRMVNGGINLLDLKPMKESTVKEDAAFLKFEIETFIISLDDIIYTDLTNALFDQKRIYVGMNKAVYNNIFGLQDLYIFIVGEAIKRVGVSYLESGIRAIQNKIVPNLDNKETFLQKILSGSKKNRFSR